MKKIYLTVLVSILTGYSIIVGQAVTFNYTGAVQTYTVPPCVYQLQVDVRGAQGMGNTDGTTLLSKGGRIQGTMSVNPGEVVDIYVGQGGIVSNAGGFNGGGAGGVSISTAYWAFYPACPSADGGGGGGASDIRVTPYALANRVIVAGGGGGTGGDRMPGCGPGAGGGGGGGYYGGGGGGGYSGLPGTGGTQTLGGTGGTSPGCSIYGGLPGNNGVLGVGGVGGDAPGNDQGTPLNIGCLGGYGGALIGGTGPNCTSGGCPGTWSGGSGGGGSNYAEPCVAAVTETQGFQTGNGQVIITPICGGSPLAVTLTATNPSCGAGCNGSISASVTGGTAPYTYSWAPGGQSTQTISGLCAGSYTVTVEDNTGCITVTASVTLTASSLAITASVTGNETCNGQCIGSAISTVTGGTPPYTYTWTPTGGNASSASSLCAGIYTVTVKDINGCIGTASVDITQPAVLAVNVSVANIPCFGGTGSATSTPTGGTSPYIYSWNPTSQTTPTATGLTAGTYTVDITDANGCTASATATIVQPPLLVATMGAISYPLCGGGTGSATVNATGGTPNYTYNWTPTGGANATGTGLIAGNYTVTVTDANGCQATASVLITQPTPVTAIITAPTYPLCNGGTGSATAIAGGGTGPYAYSWNPSSKTTATATGLTAGTYTVTVKDVNGCQATASIAITQPTPIVITTSFVHASCNLPNGSATATVTGGTSPYLYSWNPSAQTNPTANGLTAGTYTVTITDNNHCTATAAVTVTQPSAVLASISATVGVTCNALSDGTATASGTGGTTPYIYLWNPTGQSNTTATGLSAGTYTVTITDANGCQSTAAANITQPAGMTASISGPATLCMGVTGTFTATVTGGSSPYIYAWSNGQTSSIATITPTSSQTDSVTITDAKGCKVSATTTIIFGPPISVTISGKTSACAGMSTTLCADVSGGTGGNTYTWLPGNFGTPCINITPTSTTTYTVHVYDNCGRTASASITINVNPFPNVSFYSDVYQGCTPLCIQFRNTTTSPDSATQFLWSLGNGDTIQSQSPIYCYANSGSFNVTLTVTSDSGCSSTLEKVNFITVFNSPVVAFTLSPQPTTILNPTIQFTDISTDQYGLSEWAWNFGDGTDSTSTQENPSHTYQDTGTYCASLIAMDVHGCTDTVTNCLVIDPIFNLYIPSAFSPNGDGKNDTFEPKGKYLKNFEMYIFDRWGMQLYYTTDINTGWNGTVTGGSTVAQQDTYVYKILVTDSQNKQHSYVGNVTLLK